MYLFKLHVFVLIMKWKNKVINNKIIIIIIIIIIIKNNKLIFNKKIM